MGLNNASTVVNTDKSDYVIYSRKILPLTTATIRSDSRGEANGVHIPKSGTALKTTNVARNHSPNVNVREHEREKASEVAATVLSEDDVSILCEVELASTGRIHVRLPKSLLPEDFHYGMPISISFRMGPAGFREPLVTTRQPEMTPALIRENNELQALIDAL